jgi:hypothetical protein
VVIRWAREIRAGKAPCWGASVEIRLGFERIVQSSPGKASYPRCCQRPAAASKKKGNTAPVAGVRHPLPSAPAISSFPVSFPARSAPWRAKVSALYRRICLLRAQGAAAQADRLETVEWPNLLEGLRRATPFTDAELQELLAVEADRIATAEALAELLRPLLLERLPQRTIATAGTVPAARRNQAAGSVGSRGDSQKGIADFIDEMLTGEPRPKARPPSTPG